MITQDVDKSKLVYNHDYGYITQEEQDDMDIIDDMNNIYRVSSLEEFIDIETDDEWMEEGEQINPWGFNRDEVKELIKKHLPEDILNEFKKLKKKKVLYVYCAMRDKNSYIDIEEHFNELEDEDLEELIKEFYSEDYLFVSDDRMDIHITMQEISGEYFKEHCRKIDKKRIEEAMMRS